MSMHMAPDAPALPIDLPLKTFNLSENSKESPLHLKELPPDMEVIVAVREIKKARLTVLASVVIFVSVGIAAYFAEGIRVSIIEGGAILAVAIIPNLEKIYNCCRNARKRLR
jgi:hypothetical protein